MIFQSLYHTGTDYCIKEMSEEIGINHWKWNWLGGTKHSYCVIGLIKCSLEENDDDLKPAKQAQVNVIKMHKGTNSLPSEIIHQVVNYCKWSQCMFYGIKWKIQDYLKIMNEFNMYRCWNIIWSDENTCWYQTGRKKLYNTRAHFFHCILGVHLLETGWRMDQYTTIGTTNQNHHHRPMILLK